MNGGQLTVVIGGREALPVRAIPYVTEWRLPPDVVASSMDREPWSRSGKLRDLFAYHLVGAVAQKVRPRAWNAVSIQLKGLEAEWQERHAGLSPKDDHIGYAAWRRDAASKLPPGVFVWLDEFVPEYQADQKRFDPIEVDDAKQTADASRRVAPTTRRSKIVFTQRIDVDEIDMTPPLDTATRAMVLEEFESHFKPETGMSVPIGNDILSDSTQCSVATSAEASPWLIPDPNDPAPDQPWYTSARYFARQLVKDDATLLTKRNILAGKVAQSLFSTGIRKRGIKNKNKKFADGTILKALANVSLG